MQLQMSLLEETLALPGAAPVWVALDPTQRAEVVAALARLIAKLAAAPSRASGAGSQENGDE